MPTADGKLVAAEVTGPYDAAFPAEATVTLVTTRRRWRGDTRLFDALAASLHACVASWRDDDGRVQAFGTGPACPAQARWF